VIAAGTKVDSYFFGDFSLITTRSSARGKPFWA
jgi:hypothetical protein